MLQSGGSNNVTSGCLKETFHHERMAHLALQEGRTKKPRLYGGILPCATPFTDKRSLATASAEYAKERRGQTPSLSGSISPRRFDNTGSLTLTMRTEAYELPHHGIGVHDVPSPPSPRAAKEKPPAHGKVGPFGRHSIEKAFYDHVSTGNIACLH
jgi:hypothetical protein